jgi:hypothetical protein
MSRHQHTSGVNEDDALEFIRYRSIIRACDRWLAQNDPSYIKDYHRSSINTHFPKQQHASTTTNTHPSNTHPHTTNSSTQDHSQFTVDRVTGSIADIDYFGDNNDDHRPHDDETCI